MSKYIHNVSGSTITLRGYSISNSAFFMIPALQEGIFANDNATLTAIVDGDVFVSIDGATDITDIATQINVLKNDSPRDSTGLPIYRGSPFTDSLGFRFRGHSFKDTVSTNTTKDIDYLVSAERWINGGRLIVDNIGADDKLTFQVVDKDNVLGYGAGAVLDEFIKDFYIPSTGNLEVALAYPARIYAGLYLRLKYTSTHASGCTVKCNLYLHWKAS